MVEFVGVLETDKIPSFPKEEALLFDTFAVNGLGGLVNRLRSLVPPEWDSGAIERAIEQSIQETEYLTTNGLLVNLEHKLKPPFNWDWNRPLIQAAHLEELHQILLTKVMTDYESGKIKANASPPIPWDEEINYLHDRYCSLKERAFSLWIGSNDSSSEACSIHDVPLAAPKITIPRLANLEAKAILKIWFPGSDQILGKRRVLSKANRDELLSLRELSERGTEIPALVIHGGLLLGPTGVTSGVSDIPYPHIHSDDVLRLVISHFPVLDETTPWENVIAFKKDNRDKLLSLRRWVYEITRKGISQKEASIEIQYLISEYQRAMKLYELKYSLGLLRTIVTTAAEMIEDVAKFKLKDAVNVPFRIGRQKIDLLEAEMKAPGREISYIVEAHRTFG